MKSVDAPVEDRKIFLEKLAGLYRKTKDLVDLEVQSHLGTCWQWQVSTEQDPEDCSKINIWIATEMAPECCPLCREFGAEMIRRIVPKNPFGEDGVRQ